MNHRILGMEHMKNIPVGEEQISQWYKTELGRSIYAAEAAELNKILPGLFGFHFLQIGGPESVQWVNNMPIRHHVGVNSMSASKAKTSCVVADWHALPFSEESIDVVLLPHILEVDNQPETLIKEAIAVLIPEGTAIILGFNPCSLLGAFKQFSKCQTMLPNSLQLFSPHKCRRWLEDNNCEIIKHKTFYFLPPFILEWSVKKRVVIEKLGRCLAPGFGSVYILMARKRIQTLTPLRITPKRVQILNRKSVTAPTTRSTG